MPMESPRKCVDRWKILFYYRLLRIPRDGTEKDMARFGHFSLNFTE